ncbi:MAG: hypothetical protein QXF46_04110 [Thermofilaceae archaeon]
MEGGERVVEVQVGLKEKRLKLLGVAAHPIQKGNRNVHSRPIQGPAVNRIDSPLAAVIEELEVVFEASSGI